MNVYPLTVSTPDGDLYKGKAQALFVRGAEGDLAVLYGHISFVTTVKAGKCRIVDESGEEKNAICDGGILSVSSDSVTLLASAFNWIE